MLHQFNLEIPPESWGPINEQATPDQCSSLQRDYYSGNLVFEGTVFEGVGIHAKGGCGSARDLSDKTGFKVNLRWDDPNLAGCGPKRELLGQRKLTFNNVVQDQSYSHEALAYRVFAEAGVPAPRVNQVQLSVNGEYWGIYNLVESVERPFLKRWFGGSTGMMWEGAYNCDIALRNIPNQIGGSSCWDLEFTEDACDSPPKAGDDPKDWSLLSELARGLEPVPGADVTDRLRQFFDLDQLFTYWAVERIIGHWDGYFGRVVNNFRVYHHPASGLYYLVPWGTDQTFDERVGMFDINNTIADQCLNDTTCRAAFEAKLSDVADLFDSLDLLGDIAALEAKLTGLVSSAPRGRVSDSEWQNALDATRRFIEERPQAVRSAQTTTNGPGMFGAGG